MIGSLRARLFVAILGAVLLAVGASLALGVVLTRSAVRETIRSNVERQAQAFAAQVALLPANAVSKLERQSEAGGRGVALPRPPALAGPRASAGDAAGARVAARDAAGLHGPAGAGVPGPESQLLLSEAAATRLLGSEAHASLARGGAADGTARLHGREQIYVARAVNGAVALVIRPDIVSSSDFSGYLAALLIASGAAALLAAAVAVLLARRMTEPLTRLAAATRELAGGGSPEPVDTHGPTEVRELARSFDEMAQQLARARDAERSVLLSVSHDLRTPLTSIRGYAEGIEDGTVTAADGARVIAREANSLERLVGDLLALARLRQGVLEVHRETIDLAAVAREAKDRLRPAAADAGVAVKVSTGTAPALADHGRALQVVSNLLDNAIRVSAAGTEIEIEAGPGVVSVSDRGPGIPASELPRAFERFHLRSLSGEQRDGGAGLGLAIVRELTEAMGGSVAVENRSGSGARFTVRLPGG